MLKGGFWAENPEASEIAVWGQKDVFRTRSLQRCSSLGGRGGASAAAKAVAPAGSDAGPDQVFQQGTHGADTLPVEYSSFARSGEPDMAPSGATTSCCMPHRGDPSRFRVVVGLLHLPCAFWVAGLEGGGGGGVGGGGGHGRGAH